MSYPKRILLPLLLISALSAGRSVQAQTQPPPAALGMSQERLARIDAAMRDYVAEEKVAGLVTLVLRRGQVAHFGGYGYLDREQHTPMPKDAIFRIASQSKAVTSVAVMLLCEEGKLLLNDPLFKYLPEFEETKVAVKEADGSVKVGPAKRAITVRDLLTHTAGISYGQGPTAQAYAFEDVQGWYFADHDEPIGDTISRLARLPFDAQPGERFVYGFNTDILGHLVERVSGLSLADFFRQRIFEPLQMADTSFFLPEEKLARLTPVYGSGANGGLELVEKPEESEYYRGPRKCYSGGAGLLSTARDYARFLQMLLNEGELDGTRLLSRKTVELMTVNHVGDLYGNKGFGLGFWITEHVGRAGDYDTVGSFGWGGAYHTTYWVDPEESLVGVLMCQLLPARNSDLHQRFRTLVYQAIVD